MVHHLARLGQQLLGHAGAETHKRVFDLSDVALVVVVVEPYHILVKLILGIERRAFHVAWRRESVAVVLYAIVVGRRLIDQRVEGE